MLDSSYMITMEDEKKKKKEKPDFRSSLTDAYKTFDSEMKEAQEKDTEKKQEVLQEGVEKIEKKSEKDLISSKMLVSRILEIRQKAGMSQTIGTAGKIKTPILFGKEEFKQKLVNELLIIGIEELAGIGSAITITNLIDYFRETRPNWKVRTGEILEVLRTMEKAEVIPKKVDIGDDEVLVRFKPIEMSTDIQKVLILATGLPFLTVDKVSTHLGWPIERAQSTLVLMMKMDLAVLDETTGNYFFPGIGSY